VSKNVIKRVFGKGTRRLMSLFREAIERIPGYMPGEQPQDGGWIKLNTNENPYPPSPHVVEAITREARGRMNLYPDPLGTRFREAAAKLFDVDADWVLPANGSDENLTLILRSFADAADLVAYPYPSYILYETLAQLQGCRCERIPLNADWSWNAARTDEVVERSKVVLVPNPNSPSGNRWSFDELDRLVPPKGVLILDEAYGDFADEPHRGEFLRRAGGARTIVTRSFSKSYSLAGMRLGFAVAHPDLIRGMRKVKDSYNCDRLSLAAGIAALEDQRWMLDNTRLVRQTRARLKTALGDMGFAVVPSQTNFVWATHATRTPVELYEALKARKILVRLMTFKDVPTVPGQVVSGLRISIGTDAEIDRLLEELKPLV
jgi:histidinol-phosphate aminotransferase